MSINEQKLFEVLEKQRGTFCQISFLYFTAVIIGLGLVAALQANMGIFAPIYMVIFIIFVTTFFLVLTQLLYKPVEEIEKQVETIFEKITERAIPQDINSEEEI